MSDGYEHLSRIQTQTREKWDIPNSQPTELGFLERASDQQLRQKYQGRGAVFRTGIIPVYNCHGLTFASRRTSLGEASVIRKILMDDRYVRIEDVDKVLPGDIVLYVNSDDGDIEHSGVVLEVPEQLGLVKLPRILSKWGKSGEVIHWVSNCPYNGNHEYYRVSS